MTFYSDMSDISDDLLGEFGQVVTITRNTVGAYDPATGSASVSTVTQIGNGAIFEYKMLANGVNQINGTLLQQGDKRLLLSTAGITAPKLDDKVLANGITYTIKNIKETSPAGSPVLYECLLRV